MNDKNDWLNEPVSDDLKNKIFAKVQFELQENQQRYESEKQEQKASQNVGYVWWKTISMSLIAMAFLGIFFLRSLNIIDIEHPTATFAELASLTPEEFEVIENLDFIDELDDLNLNEIRKEMKKNKRGQI